ncbi:MAG: nucleotidyltransferase domain-containing protein [Nanoarchaeota archaeon]
MQKEEVKIKEKSKNYIEKLLKETLQKIKPTEGEIRKINKIAQDFGKLLREHDIRYFYGGSFAKGTFLKNLTDIDVYLLMENESEISQLKEKLSKLVRENQLKLEVLHGSRDYFHIKYKRILFEMVPVIDIKKPEEARNSTDISKFHVEFVRNNIKKKPQLKDEILLFKYFLKQKGIYGAESYNRGISGYLSEVLVINFGSFLKTLEFFKNPNFPIFIPKLSKEKIEKLKKSGKLNNYFNVLDPVLEERNLGMAVSIEKVNELIVESNRFFLNPNFSKNNKFDELKKFYNKLDKKRFALLEVFFSDYFKKNYSNPDIIGGKEKKLVEKIIKELEKENFNVYNWVFSFNKEKKEGKALILTDKSSNIVIKRGPTIGKGNIEKFLEKHKEDIVLIKDNIYILKYKKKKIEEVTYNLNKKLTDYLKIRKAN